MQRLMILKPEDVHRLDGVGPDRGIAAQWLTRASLVISPSRMVALAMLAVIVLTAPVNATPFAYMQVGTVIDTATNTVVATVAAGATGGIAMNPAGTRVYMVGSGSLDVIDTASNNIIAQIAGPAWGGVVVHPSGNRVYALDSAVLGHLYVVDAATNSVVTTIPVGDTETCDGVGLAILPDGSRLYAQTNTSVLVIDTATNTVVATVPTGATGAGNCMEDAAVNPAGTRLYVSYVGTGILVIDTATNTVLHMVTGDLGFGPRHLAINPAGTRMYVSDAGRSDGSYGVDVVDLATDSVMATISGFYWPSGLAVNPAGTRVYVNQQFRSFIGVIDTATNTWGGITTGISGANGGYGMFIGPFCPGACSDSNPCTDDMCNPLNGVCSYANNSAPCNDGTFCNGADTCDGAGGCTIHAGNPCSGGPECADSCNEAAGNCFEPVSTACSSDGNVCTDDHCDGSGACVHTANTASCDDGLFCDGTDTCVGTVCTHSGDPCGGDCNHTCNEAADNCFDVSGTPCTTDGNPCTDDVCNATGTCTHPNNTAPCDDGNACTIHDACSGGSCVGDPHICGDGVIEANCGEQCDDGGTVAGDGCDATCQLDSTGRKCKRAIGLQARKIAVKDVTLQQQCLDHFYHVPVLCQGNQCVVFVAGTATAVAGSSCAVDADCCPAFDSVDPATSTQAKIDKAVAASAKAIKQACSLSNGLDGIKGTDDDTFIDPQTLGYAATCFDVLGSCSSIATTTLSSTGSNNDLIDCSVCTAASAARTIDFHYDYIDPHVPAIPTDVRKLSVYELTQRQTCFDKVANNQIACQSMQCVLNPTAMHPVSVPGSSCTTATDCCPAFDNANPAKTTLAKLNKYATSIATALKKAMSTNNGPDGIKGTDDDTYRDPQMFGYGNTCPAVLGQCGSIVIPETSVAGPDNDLLDCIACTETTTAQKLTSFFAPQLQ
jgi:YVTN family beta-propeller protein